MSGDKYARFLWRKNGVLTRERYARSDGMRGFAVRGRRADVKLRDVEEKRAW